MKKGIHFILLISFIFFNKLIYSQAKFGINLNAINSNAQVEIETTDKGLLLPRISLVSTTSPSPLANFVEGMVIYNKTKSSKLLPGFFLCDGTQWIRLVDKEVSYLVKNGISIDTPNTIRLGGDLTQNTVINQKNKTLTFTIDTIKNAFIIGNNILNIDGLNKFVGVGTSNPTEKLHVVGGNILVTGGCFNVGSDERIKTEIIPFKQGLEILTKLNPVQYKFVEGYKSPKDEVQVGLIAQEVDKVAPFMVQEVSDVNYSDLKTLRYQDLSIMMINAFKELSLQIDTLKKELESLKKENRSLRGFQTIER